MKKELSLATSKFFTYVVSGIGWIFSTILLMFDNPVCSVLASILLLTCIIIKLKTCNRTTEPDDEMSEYNLTKAKSKTIDWLELIYAVAFLLIVVAELLHQFFPVFQEEFNINLRFLIPLLLGITEISIGLRFIKYEKAGE